MTVNHDVVGSSPTWGVDVSIEANEIVYGSVVKRLRHRPFTAVTRVRFSSESSKRFLLLFEAFFYIITLLWRDSQAVRRGSATP